VSSQGERKPPHCQRKNRKLGKKGAGGERRGSEKKSEHAEKGGVTIGLGLKKVVGRTEGKKKGSSGKKEFGHVWGETRRFPSLGEQGGQNRGAGPDQEEVTGEQTTREVLINAQRTKNKTVGGGGAKNIMKNQLRGKGQGKKWTKEGGIDQGVARSSRHGKIARRNGTNAGKKDDGGDGDKKTRTIMGVTRKRRD